ncbi:MAG: hypothetical protein JNK15_18710 [Planctomycetes bacterium]|nr:hypothetical protein [Planctomycetota bacterium]
MRHLSLLACWLTFVVASVQAQVNWLQATSTPVPPGQDGHAVAFDSFRSKIVLFGGGQTWEFDGAAWSLRTTVGSPTLIGWSPLVSGRRDHAMAYDSARHRVVLFGGFCGLHLGSIPVYFGDTWEFDGVSWLQVATPVSPPPQSEHAMAYDSGRGVVVLYGGGQTWEYNGVTWSLSSTSTSPPQVVSGCGLTGRTAHAMAFDSARARVVLFGGFNGLCGGWQPINFGDTWEFDGVQWLQASTTSSPAPQSNHAMAFDSVRNLTVLYGAGQTWEFDGVNWVQAAPASTPPQVASACNLWGRDGHAMAFDSARGQAVLFGGFNGLCGGYQAIYFSDTWMLGLPVVATATAYGNRCGSPPLGFVPDPSARPVLGQTASATVVNAPTALAGVALGFSNSFAFPISLQFELSGIGMPGCHLLQSNDVFGLGAYATGPGTLRFDYVIPNFTPLLGSHGYIQSYALAPGVNPLQVVVSNAIDWKIGIQ